MRKIITFFFITFYTLSYCQNNKLIISVVFASNPDRKIAKDLLERFRKEYSNRLEEITSLSNNSKLRVQDIRTLEEVEKHKITLDQKFQRDYGLKESITVPKKANILIFIFFDVDDDNVAEITTKAFNQIDLSHIYTKIYEHNKGQLNVKELGISKNRKKIVSSFVEQVFGDGKINILIKKAREIEVGYENDDQGYRENKKCERKYAGRWAFFDPDIDDLLDLYSDEKKYLLLSIRKMYLLVKEQNLIEKYYNCINTRGCWRKNIKPHQDQNYFKDEVIIPTLNRFRPYIEDITKFKYYNYNPDFTYPTDDNNKKSKELWGIYYKESTQWKEIILNFLIKFISDFYNTPALENYKEIEINKKMEWVEEKLSVYSPPDINKMIKKDSYLRVR